MKHSIFAFLLLFSSFIFLTCQDKTTFVPQPIQEKIDLVRKDFVKDKRTALFDITPKAGVGQAVILTGETIFPAAKKALFEKLRAAGTEFIDSILVLPAADLNGKNYGIVNLSVCNIRSLPKHSAELATQAIMGTPLRVYKKAGDFYYVQTPDDYLGWVDDGGLVLLDSESFKNWQSAPRSVCLHDYAFIYESNDEQAGKVTDLMAGSILEFLENQGSFAKVRLPDGRQGFVKNSQLMPYPAWIASRDPSPANILATAKEMMGRPYLWGGTSGKGMDCSGFTKTVFYLHGIQLERDASLQVHNGEMVQSDTTLKNLLPGDLLFFGNLRADGSERISHVAIYMGDGKIIHASDLVKIESLKRGDPDFVEDRLTSFMKAKRVIGSEDKNGIQTLAGSPWY